MNAAIIGQEAVVDRVKAMAPQHPEWQDKEPFASLLAGNLWPLSTMAHSMHTKPVSVNEMAG